MKPKLSVIIPIYNTSQYLEECIDSVLSQTYKNLEILLIDDGSTDDSLQICNDYSARDGRIRVVHQNNSGVSVARNAGIEECTGDYALFLDSDDSFSGMDDFEILIDAFSDINEMQFGLFRVWHLNENYSHKIFSRKTKRAACSLIVSEKINAPWGKIYNINILKKNNIRFPVGVKIGEDLIFNVRYAKFVETIHFIDYGCYRYRTDNMNSATKKVDPTASNDLAFARNEIKQWAIQSKSIRLYVAYIYLWIKNNYSITMKRFRYRGGHNEKDAN